MGAAHGTLKKVVDATDHVDRDLNSDVNRRLSLSVHHQAISDHEGDDCPIAEIQRAAQLIHKKSKVGGEINPEADQGDTTAVLATGNVPGPKKEKPQRPTLKRRKSVRDRWKDALKMVVASRKKKDGEDDKGKALHFTVLQAVRGMKRRATGFRKTRALPWGRKSRRRKSVGGAGADGHRKVSVIDVVKRRAISNYSSIDIAEGNIDGFMSYAQASITTLKHQHNIAVAAGKKTAKWPCLTVTFPTEGWRWAWDVFISFCCLWSAVALPYVACFDDTGPFGAGAFLAVNALVDLAFACDIFVTGFTAVHNDVVQWELDAHVLWNMYLRSWFVFDLLAAMPWEHMLAGGRGWLALKAVRVVRVKRYGLHMPHWRWLSDTHRGHVSSTFSTALLAIHWSGCVVFAVTRAEAVRLGLDYEGAEADAFGEDGAWDPSLGWVAELGGASFAATRDLWTETSKSYYIAFMMLVNENPEAPTNVTRWVSILVMMVGACGTAVLFGEVAVLMHNYNRAENRYKAKMDEVNENMQSLQLPLDLQTRVRHYYNYLWTRYRATDRRAFLGDLSPALRSEVVLHLHLEMVAKVPIFEQVESAFLVDLMNRLVFLVFLPGDYVIRAGTFGEEMYFISHGACDVLVRDPNSASKQHKIVHTFRTGSYFGEVAVFRKTRRTATIRARTYCDLNMLNKHDVDELCTEYPKSGASIRAAVADRIKSYSEQEDKLANQSPDGSDGGGKGRKGSKMKSSRRSSKRRRSRYEQAMGADERERLSASHHGFSSTSSCTSISEHDGDEDGGKDGKGDKGMGEARKTAKLNGASDKRRGSIGALGTDLRANFAAMAAETRAEAREDLATHRRMSADADATAAMGKKLGFHGDSANRQRSFVDGDGEEGDAEIGGGDGGGGGGDGGGGDDGKPATTRARQSVVGELSVGSLAGFSIGGAQAEEHGPLMHKSSVQVLMEIEAQKAAEVAAGDPDSDDEEKDDEDAPAYARGSHHRMSIGSLAGASLPTAEDIAGGVHDPFAQYRDPQPGGGGQGGGGGGRSRNGRKPSRRKRMSMASVGSEDSRMHSVASLAGMPSNQNFFADPSFAEDERVDRDQVEKWTRDAMGDMMQGLRTSLGSLIHDEVHALGKQMKRQMSDAMGVPQKVTSMKEMLHASKMKRKQKHRRAYDAGDGRKGPPVVGAKAGTFKFSNGNTNNSGKKKKKKKG